jgi:positive regulator of sigma E activity
MQRSGTETGTVLQTDGLTAKVIINKSKSCSECGKAEAGICGKQGAGMVMTVSNAIGARQGDIVTLDIDRSTHVKAYLAAFILPMVALFAFSYIGNRTGIQGLDIILGLAALALSLLIAVSLIRRIDRHTRLRISSITGKDESFEAMTQEERDYLKAYNINSFS